MLVALAIVAGTVSGASKCAFKIELYTDDTCSTSKEVLPWFEGGSRDFNLKFNKCYAAPSGSNAIKITHCDPDMLIAYQRFTDDTCKTKNSPPIEAYYTDEACKPMVGGNWYKVTNVELTGNKYGIGWREGLQIFLCQTVLFGVCAGY